jgi:hypothetical protein
VVIFPRQTQSQPVAWTLDDLLKAIQATDIDLVRKIHLLEDCTSLVVIDGVMDHTG